MSSAEQRDDEDLGEEDGKSLRSVFTLIYCCATVRINKTKKLRKRVRFERAVIDHIC